MGWCAVDARAAQYGKHQAIGNSLRPLPLTFAAALVLAIILAPAATTVAQTWTGGGTIWNTAANWSPAIVPNSSTANVNFSGNGIFYAVNISSSVSARSLSFSNPTLGYSLTSSTNQTLSGVSSINVAAGVTGVQSINLANVASGSLIFPSSTGLTITNNSTAAGTTLVIGPNTVFKQTAEDSYVEVTGAGRTEISGALRANMTLIKSGSGTLILSNPTNTYTRTNAPGTFVDEGTLLLGVGTAIPTGERVYVKGSGEFNIGSLSNSAATSMGSLQFEDGVFRVPSGNGDYYVKALSMDAGTVNFAGTSNFWLHLTGPGPFNTGIYASANSKTAVWIGSGTSRIQNDTAAPLPIMVIGGDTPTGIDLDAGIILSNGGTNPTFIKDGAGTMRLTNPGNTANFNVVAGKLRVDNMANLGSGIITVNGGTLQYGGSGETTTKNLTIEGTAAIQVSTPSANLNYNGVISQTTFANLHVVGPGTGIAPSTLTLNNNSNYYGNTTIDGNAILAIATINNIGDASPIGTNLFSTGLVLGSMDTRGTLLLTGTSAAYSSNRKASLNGSYFSGGGGAFGVQSAPTSLTLSGQMTGSGSLIKTGAGTILLANTSNNYSGGTYVEGGRLHVDNDAALGSADVRVFSSATLRYTANASISRSLHLADGTVEAPAGISLATGQIQGQGTIIGNVANSGFVVPENSTGLLTIAGNYTQSSSGRMTFFADLLLPPGTNPRLVVTGSVALDGTLQMNLGSMGQFRGTRSFDVLDWTGSLNGTTFSSLQLPTNGGAFTWDTSQLYTTGVLTLTGPPLEGDYNNDGRVDAADYVAWRKGFGTLYTDTHYALWRSHFGQIAGGFGAGLTASGLDPVPEPNSNILLLFGLAAIAAGIVRKRDRMPTTSSFKTDGGVTSF